MTDSITKRKAELMAAAGDDGQSYPPFGFQDLDDASFQDYWELTNYYSQTDNGYFAIRTFVHIVKSGIAPPPWVLNALCEGFDKYLVDLSPEKLAKHLKLTGEASGKPHPFNVKKHAALVEPMADMSRLIHIFETPKLTAAKAVKDKYNIKVTAKHLAKYYREKWHPLLPRSPLDFKLVLNAADHQKFVKSFTSEIRRTFKK